MGKTHKKGSGLHSFTNSPKGPLCWQHRQSLTNPMNKRNILQIKLKREKMMWNSACRHILASCRCGLTSNSDILSCTCILASMIGFILAKRSKVDKLFLFKRKHFFLKKACPLEKSFRGPWENILSKRQDSPNFWFQNPYFDAGILIFLYFFKNCTPS